jgi:dTDP-4-amino-4,6-dideoxygalactose transaminase
MADPGSVSPMSGRTSANDFALFGGAPALARSVHVGRPNVGSRKAFLARVESILDSRWLTNHGRLVGEFEAQVAEIAGVGHAVAVSSGTTGLQVLARVLGLHGPVVLPAFTFVATAHALRWEGCEPVFADVLPDSHNMDPSHVESVLTEQTSAIVGVHLWGSRCDTDAIEAMASDRGIPVIYDAAHSFACSADGRPIGSFGAAEVFSFHATKFVNTFEGGCIVTDDEELAHRARLATNFGIAGYDQFEALGINGKMSEVAAAMGLTCLESLDDIVRANRERYEVYRERLGRLPGVRVLVQAESGNNQYVVLEIEEDQFGLSRDELHRLIWEEGVLARRYFYPGVHRVPPYVAEDGTAPATLPVTEELCRRVLVLPTGPDLSMGELATVIDLIHASHQLAPQLRVALSDERRSS